MSKPLIKICGNTNIGDATAALEYGADLIGFIFYEKSPRYISPEKAGTIIKKLNEKFAFKSVGVFVNPSREDVDRIISAAEINILQFHGEEPPDFIKLFHKKIIKAIRIKNSNDIAKCDDYHFADYLLLDAFSLNCYGGTGKTFDWGAMDNFKYRNKLILAGGISIENIGDALKKIRPLGIDLCSSIEKEPGKKNHEKMKDFFSALPDAGKKNLSVSGE